MILLDTNILIELFKGNQGIIAASKKIGISNITISKITIFEMYVGALNKKELKIIKNFLEKFSQVTITSSTLKIAERLLYQYRLSHGLYINDALIAACGQPRCLTT